MPKFLEEKLKKEYPNNPHAVYGTMNKVGAMHGNKETAKGRGMEAKHERDTKAMANKKMGYGHSKEKMPMQHHDKAHPKGAKHPPSHTFHKIGHRDHGSKMSEG